MVEALPAPSWTVGGEGDVPDDEPEVLLDVLDGVGACVEAGVEAGVGPDDPLDPLDGVSVPLDRLSVDELELEAEGVGALSVDESGDGEELEEPPLLEPDEPDVPLSSEPVKEPAPVPEVDDPLVEGVEGLEGFEPAAPEVPARRSSVVRGSEPDEPGGEVDVAPGLPVDEDDDDPVPSQFRPMSSPVGSRYAAPGLPFGGERISKALAPSSMPPPG